MADTTLTGILSTTFVDKPDDVLSAKTYADAAANAANAASTSENNAATSEAQAKTSETNAKTSETNAASSATAAATFETNAKSSATAAASSASAAASSATAAAQSESNVSTYKDQTKSYAYSAITTVATLTYATDAEATAGTATDRMISPATLKAVVDAAVKEAKLDAHPVGSYYFSDDSTSPTDLFGGTWEALPPGYGLVAQGTATAEDGSTLTFTAGNKYGEFKHQLTVGELPYIEKIPVWSDYADPNKALLGHATDGSGNTSINDYGVGPVNGMNVGSRTFTLSVSLPGNGKAHDNISPCLAAYAWKRTA